MLIKILQKWIDFFHTWNIYGYIFLDNSHPISFTPSLWFSYPQRRVALMIQLSYFIPLPSSLSGDYHYVPTWLNFNPLFLCSIYFYSRNFISILLVNLRGMDISIISVFNNNDRKCAILSEKPLVTEFFDIAKFEIELCMKVFRSYILIRKIWSIFNVRTHFLCITCHDTIQDTGNGNQLLTFILVICFLLENDCKHITAL